MGCKLRGYLTVPAPCPVSSLGARNNKVSRASPFLSLATLGRAGASYRVNPRGGEFPGKLRRDACICMRAYCVYANAEEGPRVESNCQLAGCPKEGAWILRVAHLADDSLYIVPAFLLQSIIFETRLRPLTGKRNSWQCENVLWAWRGYDICDCGHGERPAPPFGSSTLLSSQKRKADRCVKNVEFGSVSCGRQESMGKHFWNFKTMIYGEGSSRFCSFQFRTSRKSLGRRSVSRDFAAWIEDFNEMWCARGREWTRVALTAIR